MSLPAPAALTQGVPLPLLYINGLGTAPLTNTTLTGLLGQCRDADDAWDILIPANVIIDTTKIGLNGLDTGVLAASTTYYVYAIGSSVVAGPDGYLLSTNGNYAPFMPFNYDLLRLIGTVSTDGSTHLLPNYTFGSGSSRTINLATTVSVLSAGNTTTFTPVDLNAAVPVIPNNTTNGVLVTLNYSFTPAVAGHVFELRPTGSTATTVQTYTGPVAAVAMQGTTTVLALLSGLSGHMSIDYLVSASGDALTLTVASYSFVL